MKRIFLALELPEDIKKRIIQVQKEFKDGFRWIKSEQMHMTLAFLGEMTLEQIQKIKEELSGIKGKKFLLILDRVGFFSRKRIAHVLWLDVKKEPLLFELQGKIIQGLENIGIVLAEKRAFSPHITIGRSKNLRVDKAALIVENFERIFLEETEIAEKNNNTFNVDSFILYSSELKPSGPIYCKEAVFPLV